MIINNFANQSAIPVEKRQKQLYEAPSTMVFGVRTEGVMCGSPVNALLFDVQNYPQWDAEDI